MSLNSIGSFLFLDLAGQVQLLKEETELLKRPGVNGVGMMLTGYRGEPFKLRSKVDVGSLGLAEDLYASYLGYVGGEAQPLIQYGCVFAVDGVGFLVLDVQKVEKRAFIGLAGCLNPPSLAWLECDWTLVCVAIEQQGGDE